MPIIIDVLFGKLLLTSELRIGGSAADNHDLSFWLMVFLVFLFLLLY